MADHAELVRQVVDVCLNVKSGENVLIHSWDHTIDLASGIAFACRERGAHPLITLETENYWMRSLRETPKGLLEVLPSHQAGALRKTDAFIFMLGPRSPINWDKIPPEKRELANVWYLDTNRYVKSWRKIIRKRSVRVLGVEYGLVTEERAQAFGLDYEKWRNVMLAGCVTDQKEIARKAARLASLMREGREVLVQSPFGTNLKFRLTGRKPVIGDSIVSREDAVEGVVKFLPSGFVEVAPDENSAEGILLFDAQILVPGGKRIQGLCLEFKRGKVLKYSAQMGIDAFENYIKSSKGDIDKFGFFGIGLNSGLKHGFTQDDKVLGGVSIGIGGNKDKGGKNRTLGNAHWWASMTKATLQIDDHPVLKDGVDVF